MKKHNTNRVRRQPVQTSSQQLPWRFFILTIICACILAAGFFFAARQHFATMDFGLKNSKLRKQIEDLESERRRLILAREVSLSPMEITQTAERLGFKSRSDVPGPAVISLPAKSTPLAEIRPVAASLNETKTSGREEIRDNKMKNVVKPIVQQSNVKALTPNERPRMVAEQDKRVAITTIKPDSKPR